jgi:hypothetical protein
MLFRNQELSSSEVAERLRISHGHAAQLMRSGVIGARQLPSGDWLTNAGAIETYEMTVKRGRGRALSSASAWGVLWELSGLRPSWLTSSTRSRLRGQLAQWSSEDIIRAVAGRTRATRYSSTEAIPSVGLISTGRSVAGHLRVGLKSNPKLASGYPRTGTVAEYVTLARMKPDYEGKHALFENTLPVAFREDRMPVAVIAADLARDPSPDNRAKGLQALEQIWDDWAASQ